MCEILEFREVPELVDICEHIMNVPKFVKFVERYELVKTNNEIRDIRKVFELHIASAVAPGENYAVSLGQNTRASRYDHGVRSVRAVRTLAARIFGMSKRISKLLMIFKIFVLLRRFC